jgi:D-sedoheptulose 7-phosphate isomerase
LVRIADFALVVDSSSTPRIQEAHITIGHVICEMVDRMLFQQPG